MIQPLFDGMLAILLAKFLINDLPHAAGLLNLPVRALSLGNPIVVPDVDTFILPETRRMIEADVGLYDERLVGLRDYLQEYTNLAHLGLEYPDYKVDSLFQQSFRLSKDSILHLHARISYWMHELDFQEYLLHKDPRKIEEAREKLAAARAAMRAAERTLGQFYDAKTRVDKALAIDSLVGVCHLTGYLLNELFLFPPFHEPTHRYVTEILDALSSKGGTE